MKKCCVFCVVSVLHYSIGIVDKACPWRWLNLRSTCADASRRSFAGGRSRGGLGPREKKFGTEETWSMLAKNAPPQLAKDKCSQMESATCSGIVAHSKNKGRYTLVLGNRGSVEAWWTRTPTAHPLLAREVCSSAMRPATVPDLTCEKRRVIFPAFCILIVEDDRVVQRWCVKGNKSRAFL
jgi:hypothetical protein